MAIADALNSRHAHRVRDNAVSSVLRVLEQDGLIDPCQCRAERPRPRTRCFALTALGHDILGLEMERLRAVFAMATETGAVTTGERVGPATRRDDRDALTL